MRYRKLTASGDMTFGHQQNDFWINQPEAVAQAVWTRLQLQLGSWFQDINDGTNWKGAILGVRTTLTRDAEIKSRTMLTTGVTAMDNYSSSIDPNTRAWSASFGLETAFGPYTQLSIKFILPGGNPIVMPVQPQNVNATQTGVTTAQASWQAGS